MMIIPVAFIRRVCIYLKTKRKNVEVKNPKKKNSDINME